MVNLNTHRIERYSISLTYRCNASCKGCNRFLDIWEWPSSDITLADLTEGFKRLCRDRAIVAKIRLSGGEPLLHPQYEEAARLIVNVWNKWPIENRKMSQWVTVFTNGIIKPPSENIPYLTHRSSGVDEKKPKRFWWPMMISPHDLGMRFSPNDLKNGCRRSLGCGRLFDAFGFSFCTFAGALGRLFGIDPYSAKPVTETLLEICKHCPFSVGNKKAFQLFAGVGKGKIEYPTKTYRKIMSSCKPMLFKRFLEREYQE